MLFRVTLVHQPLPRRAGLHPESEIFRLRWEDIDFEQNVITVDGDESDVEETKTGRRVVKMKANLVALLQAFAKPVGPIIASQVMLRKFRTDKRKIGYGTPRHRTLQRKSRWHPLKRWPEDITRHTYGSHLLADCNDIGVVSTQMGHSPDVVRKHYLAPIKTRRGRCLPGNSVHWAVQHRSHGRMRLSPTRRGASKVSGAG